MRKLAFSVVAVGLATVSSAYAAVPTGAAPFQVTVPNLQPGVNFTLEGLYVQPTNSDLVYDSTDSTSGNTVTNNSEAVKPNYGFGFGIGLGYVFPQSGNDVQAHWQHFNHGTTDSTLSAVTLDNLSGQETVTSDAVFKFDTVDLDVGQYLNMGTRFQTRLFAGLRYANLQNNVTDTTVDVLNAVRSTETLTDVTQMNSKFQGVGPRLGVDASYHVSNCFGVVSHLAAALLVGQTTDSTTDNNSQDAGPTDYTADNQTRVVPSLDAKLGFDYTIPFKNQMSNMTIEAGYQVSQFIDAIDRIHGNNDIVTSSLGFNGPYLSLNFKI